MIRKDFMTPLAIRNVVGSLFAAALALSATVAHAQIGEFPNLKGNSARTGRNEDPLNTGPGLAKLNWFAPFGAINTTTIVLDNTAVADSSGYLGGPYDPATYGTASSLPGYIPQKAAYDSTKEWAGPKVADEASFPYLQIRRSVNSTTGLPSDNNRRDPAYAFTRCVPSDTSGDPTQAAVPADRRFFQWSFTGPAGATRYYQIYAWLPIGSTRVGTGRIFPQRYFVYEVLYGAGQRYIDVVDTYASGGGFIKLGNGGKQTNAVFPYDGTNPIRVRLYNTVPRDAGGTLTMPTPVSNYCVYADAVKAAPGNGSITATPTTSGFGGTSARTTVAVNTVTTSIQNNQTLFNVRGVVNSYVYNFPDTSNLKTNLKWSFSPFAGQNGEGDRDNDSADTHADLGWTTTNSTKFLNGTFLESTLVTSGAPSGVTYSPNLTPGDYDVYVYLPGGYPGKTFGTKVVYQVVEGAKVSQYTVNQTSSLGWYRLGGKRFTNLANARLKLRVTNLSLEPNDAGLAVFADGIRFVNSGNQAINSTPVHASVRLRQSDGSLASKNVVIVADEAGRIHCLDANGRGGGATTEYWQYPSRQRTATYVDPNFIDGIDAKNNPAPTPDTVAIAEMPTGFDLSTALVQRIGNSDYLYIASTNGRIYCIDMAGRGDFDVNARLPGTTSRIWSYPDDFPSPNPKTSTLGAFTGSISFGKTSAGNTIFAASSSGRVYALDALPTDTTNQANRTTRTRWLYPALTETPLGSIKMTPTYEFGVLMFGTTRTADLPGRFYALDGRTGKPQWVFPSNAQLADPAVDSDIRNMGNFISSPVSVPSTLLEPGMSNTVFVLNENRYLYALPVDGTADRQPTWKTNELGVGAVASLGFTSMTVNDKNLNLQPNTPVIMVPTSDGRFDGLFARLSDINRAGTRRCFEYVAEGDSITASMAFSRGFMYGADNQGYVYAFSNIGGNFSSGWGTPPGQEGTVENDPAGDRFRDTKITLLTRDGYTRLRQPSGSADHLTYAQATSGVYSFTRNPFAFEWGETVYVMVYDFPGVGQDSNGRLVPPPIVNISFNVEGQTVRSIPVESQLFENPNVAPVNSHDPSLKNDSYAVLAFTFQGGGPNALPPGNAEISVSISTQSLNGRQAFQNVALDPNLARKPFLLANPLAIAVQADSSAYPQGIANQGVGLSTFPDNPQNLINGSANVASGTVARPTGDRISDSVINSTDESRVLATAGFASHGQSKTSRLFVYDRSMMGLIRPDNRGLDNVRLMLDDLAWQGGRSTIYKRLDSTLFPNFEDSPVNYPNLSLDYPDIRRDNVVVSKDPNGDAENPVNSGVALLPPIKSNGDPLDEDTKPEDRILRPTIFDVTVNVPRFQPPNNAFATGTNPAVPVGSGAIAPNDPRYRQVDSSGAANVVQGYLGRFSVFVDTTQNGILEASSREAYRSFNLATAVLPDERISVVTPSVDPGTKNPTIQLGSLAGGSGYTSDGANNPFSPLSANYGDLFKDFQVLNDGNMNLLDVRLSKGSRNIYPNSVFGAFVPEQFFSGENDDQTWLDGSLDLWANFDTVFAPTYGTPTVNYQIIQKARVGDTVSTQLVVNPSRRTNPNLNVGSSESARRLIPALPSSKPAVAVTIPFGFPVGRYTQTLRVIENNVIHDDTWDRANANTVESFSDPQFDVSFTVRETRLTNSFTQKTAPLIDDYDTSGKTLFTNSQPTAMRDANGGLYVAWASNRPTDSAALPTATSLSNSTRIYVASLDNAAGFLPTRLSPPSTAPNFIRSLSPRANGYTPLRDLGFFTPASTSQWFKKAPGSANGYPSAGTDLKALFGATNSGESIAPNTDKFGNPSFPANGNVNPFRAANTNRTANRNAFPAVYMAFTGEAQKITPTGREVLSKLFVTTVGVNADGTASGLGTPVAMPYDDFTAKGKAAVVQTNGGALIFYPATSGGTGTINYTRFNGSVFTPPTGLAFGDGFESVFGPSVVGRFKNNSATTPVLEFTFSGKLRGRSSADLYLGRINLNQGTLRPAENPDGTLVSDAFADQPARSRERITPLENGAYAARGVQWNRTQPIALIQNINGTETDLLIPGTQTFDRESGLISYESRLGGRVVFDPTLGTVKFAGTTPSRSAILRLTYTPRFVKISENGSVASTGTNGVFDDRAISDFSYWTLASGAQADATSDIKNDRMIFTYVRGAGAGSGARPYMATYRFGLRLPTPVYTNDNGSVLNLSVTGNVGPYQVDPSNGRVYFTAADEDRPVSISYTGADVGTGAQLASQFSSGNVSLIQERPEAPILIEQASNESNVTAFIDPFDFPSSDFRVRRPPLTWLFWTSNRAGYPDIYFETVAPRLTPLPISK
jgi:hypothetical protein